MASLKNKAVKAGLSVLVGTSLFFLSVDTLIKIQKDKRVSLRERVYELVLQKYKGDYYTKIDGRDIHVGAVIYESHRPDLKNRGLYVEYTNYKEGFYLLDLAEAGLTENTFLGDLDCFWGKVKSPEQEFDNYLRIVKEEIGKP